MAENNAWGRGSQRGSSQPRAVRAREAKYQIYISKCRHRLPSVPQIMYEWEGLKYNLSKVEYWREPLEDIRELVTRMMH
jgi:hypothetical protein